MAVAARIFSLVIALISIGALLLAVFFVRRETRIRPGRDVLRFALSMATAVAMTLVHGAGTPVPWIAVALAAGAALGVFQGAQVRLRADAGRLYARRTIPGVIGWGAGVTLLQLAGVFGRAGLVPLGTAGSFFGAALLGGMVLGRSGVRRAALGPAVLLLACGWLFPGLAGAEVVSEVPPGAPVHDLPDLFAGGAVEGLTVTIHGTGSYYGPSIRIEATNTTDTTQYVRIPVGLRLRPGNEAAQTMITAGGEIIAIPPTAPGAEPQSDRIVAFCGEQHDGIPGSGETFTPDGMAEAQVRRTAENIRDRGVFDSTAQSAMWGATDGYDVSRDQVASQLLAGEGGLPPEAAVRLSLVGLAGEALLLATALANAGVPVDQIVAAWRDGRWNGLQTLVDGAVRPTDAAGQGWEDPEGLLDSEGVRRALDGLPPDERSRVTEALLQRLRDDHRQRISDAALDLAGPIGPGTDIDRLLDDPKIRDLLDRLPPTLTDPNTGEPIDTWTHIRTTLDQQRLQNTGDAAWTIFRNEGIAADYLRILEQSRQPGTDPAVLTDFWDGLDPDTRDYLEQRFPRDEIGPGGPPPPIDPDTIVAARDPLLVLRENPRLRDYLDTLDPKTRAEVEAGLLDRINRQVLDEATARVGDLAGPIGPGTDIDRLLDDPKIRDLLDRLPPTLTDPNTGKPIDTWTHIRTTLDQQRFDGAVGGAHHRVELDLLRERLAEAVRRGDPAEVQRILTSVPAEEAEALSASLTPEAPRPAPGTLSPTVKPGTTPPPPPSAGTGTPPTPGAPPPPPGSGAPPPSAPPPPPPPTR